MTEPIAESLLRRRPPLLAAGLLFGLSFAAPPAFADYPIASHRYLADPAAWVHEGRVYLYCSNDDDNTTDDAYLMASIVAVSSSDLKNWTDHGEVLRVPRDASWANMSWAPAVIARDGTFFMYFGNNANGIGVVSSDSPIGPFEDPRGSALVNSSTPGASGTDIWLFDPAVFIDDDDQAYLYFGGNGEGNVRIGRLNADMISLNGSLMPMTVPYFFEASWMHKRDGVYYFSYSTNPENGMRIDYLTSSSPTSGFTHQGTAGPQPPSNNNNNHASIFLFNDQWYHAYHNRFVANESGDPPGYKRSIALEALTHNSDGSIEPVVYTTDGLPQLQNFNPYTRVEAETFNAQNGIETATSSEGGMALTDIDAGDWVRLRGVDFGSMGAESFSARVAGTGSGTIELRLDGENGMLAGTCDVASTGGAQTWANVMCAVTGATGVKDLHLRFTGSDFSVNYWEFAPIGGGSGGAGAGGMGGASSGGMSGDGGVAGMSGGTGGATAGGTSGASGSTATGGSAGNGGASAGMPGSGGTGGASATGGANTAGTVASGGVSMGGASTSGGSTSSGAVGGSAPAATASDESGGCGCRVGGRPSSALWLGMLAAAAVALRRVRRRAGVS